jgi:hypothetical protein
MRPNPTAFSIRFQDGRKGRALVGQVGGGGPEELRKPILVSEHLLLGGSDMNAGARTNGGLSAVPLLNAVFCAGCETISNSPHDVCSVCGSRSLLNLFRMLDGTLRGQMSQSAKDHGKTAKYNVELTVKVHEIPANELNRTIESISRLAEVYGDLESLHINVEPVLDNAQAVLRAA